MMLHDDRRYAYLNADQRDAIMQEAQRNAAASMNAQRLAGGQNIGEAMPPMFVQGIPVAVPADTVIGVRVVMTVVPAHGTPETVSVVINAAAGATVGNILQAAEAWVESGQMNAHTGHASPGLSVGAAAIASVAIGGYANAAFGVL